MSTAAETEVDETSSGSNSSSTTDSRLPESSGISWFSVGREMEIAGVEVEGSGVGSQQKVSRFHNLQLRFSNLRPCSNDPAHRENTRQPHR